MEQDTACERIIKRISELETFDRLGIALDLSLPYGTVSGRLSELANAGYIENTEQSVTRDYREIRKDPKNKYRIKDQNGKLRWRVIWPYDKARFSTCRVLRKTSKWSEVEGEIEGVAI